MNKIFILSGNYRQSEWIGEKLNIPPKGYIHIHSADQIRGYRGATLIIYGSVYEIPTKLYDEINIVAINQEFTILSIDDMRR